MRYTIAIILSSIIMYGCKSKSNPSKINNEKLITENAVKDSLFIKIASLIQDNDLPDDSVSFLIVPIDATCNACTDKSIDSIINHIDMKETGRKKISIISGASHKSILAYFSQRNVTLPAENKNLFYDDENAAFLKELLFHQPTIYYAYNKKVYKRIISTPITIKENLHDFFRD